MRGAWLVVVILAAGCGDAPKLETGDRCSLSSECAAPLVCRLERCRRECATTRDCPAGSACVMDESGFGACQLEAERECVRPSDCPTPLVCRFGQCTNPCGTNEDCPAGAFCLNDPSGTGTACVDMAMDRCQINSDCPLPLICAVDNLCREECREDRDCRDGLMCIGMSGTRVCGVPGPDAGPPDAGPDSGIDAGIDAGPLDGGPLDAGTDAGPDAGMMTPLGRRIALGSMHGCRVSMTGALECWGQNAFGQIGDGTTTRRTRAVSVLTGGVIEATGGGAHTCVLDVSGLRCWGENGDGQLGDGTLTGQTSPPTALTLGFTPVRIDAGARTTCAIDSTGDVWCWGDNQFGQVGDGTVVDPRSSPRAVALPGPAAQVAVGTAHACALLEDETVQCWGNDDLGQLGDGPPMADRSVPGAVPGLSGIVEITSGTYHSCARRRAGTVICWGDDGYSQMGDGITGSPAFADAPTTDVVGLTDAVEIGAGIYHTCARQTGGTVVCWGNDVNNQLGVDRFAMMDLDYPTPVAVTGLTGALELGVGEHHACVRRAADYRCWGRGLEGQLGNGLTTDMWMHVLVMP